MDRMDTNINNYSIEEIINLIKINEYNCELDNIFFNVIELLDKINNTYDTDDINHKKNILLFFRNCFYKICSFYNLNPSESMKKIIDSKLLINKLNFQINEIENKEANQFVGALPIKIPEATTISSNIDKYARGLVNPLQRETINNILTINSKFRDQVPKFIYDKNNSSTDFSIMLTEPFNNVVSLKLASLEFMNSYYSISEYLKTNIFTIQTYNLNTTTNAITNLYTKEITIKEGSYTSDIMVLTLNEIFDTDVSLNMITTSYNQVKGKIFFVIKDVPPTPPPPGTEYAFNLNFTISEDKTRPLFLNYGWLMGFQKDEYIFSTEYVKIATPTKEIGFNSEAPLDFTGTKFFLLEVTDYNNNSPDVLKYNANDRYGFNVKDILAKIPNVSSAYSLIFEDSSDRVFKIRKYFGPVKIQKLRIRLLDENGKLVDLNRGDIVISFEVELLDVPYKNKVY
jgi:hypothetical protein